MLFLLKHDLAAAEAEREQLDKRAANVGDKTSRLSRQQHKREKEAARDAERARAERARAEQDLAANENKVKKAMNQRERKSHFSVQGVGERQSGGETAAKDGRSCRTASARRCSHACALRSARIAGAEISSGAGNCFLKNEKGKCKKNSKKCFFLLY